jgi:hypothetical protein
VLRAEHYILPFMNNDMLVINKIVISLFFWFNLRFFLIFSQLIIEN